jgi:hypothetical protein
MPPAVRGPLCQEPDLESDTAEPGSAEVQATLNGLDSSLPHDGWFLDLRVLVAGGGHLVRVAGR